jgi:acyl-CoA dehydrogenase
MSNFARVVWLGLTRGRALSVPGDRHTRRYYQQLTRLSSAFALAADFTMLVMGGALKRRERLSARLGDILSQMYLASCALKRYEDCARPAEDLPLVHWSVRDAFYRIDEAFYALFVNMPRPGWCMIIYKLIFPYGREFKPPRDDLGRQVVRALLEPGPARERLTAGVYVPRDENEPVGALEAALRAVIAAEPVEAKLRAAVKAGAISGKFAGEIAAQALAGGAITQSEADLLGRAATLRRKAIMVDDFPRDLGRSEVFQTSQPVTFETLRRKHR